MSKKVTSVSLDEDVAERFAHDDSLNLSGTANRLLRQYLDGDRGEVAMLELREEQLKSEISSLESDLENKRAELELVQERLADTRAEKAEEREDVLPEAADVFDRMPQSELTEENEAVQNWARKADLAPAELLDWYHTEYGGGGK